MHNISINTYLTEPPVCLEWFTKPPNINSYKGQQRNRNSQSSQKNPNAKLQIARSSVPKMETIQAIPLQ